MASRTGYGKIPTSGLRLFYDTGDTDVSFKGKPTINYVTNAGTMANFGNYSCGTPVTFTTEFGTTGYRMHNLGSWNGVVMGGISLPSAGTYTFSAYIRYLGGSSNNNGGTVYTSGFGIGTDTASYHNKSIVGEWFRLTNTQTCTTAGGTFYLISYGGTYCDDYSSWEVTMPQIEAGSIATPWVDGSRSTTTSLLDITGNSTLEVMNNPFDANGNFNLDGTNTYIQVNQDVLSSNSPYTLVTIMRPTDLASMDYSFPQYNTYPYGFWHHVVSDGWVAWRHAGGYGTMYTHGMSNNTWGMHSITWDGNTLKLFVNGVLSTSVVTSASYSNNGSGKARIGMLSQRTAGYDYNYNGKLPVNMVYNRAISQSEMFDIYKHFKPRYSLPSVKDGSTSVLAAPNAQHLYDLGIRARGTYWIKPTSYGGSAQEIYCDFDSNGGWMLVASNNASDVTIPGGTARNSSEFFINRGGVLGSSNPNGDYIIGSILDDMVFSKVRIIGWGFASTNGTYSFPSNLGTYVTAEWNLTTTGNSRYTEKVSRGNVTIGGNGTIAPSANYFVLDAVQNNIGFNANTNQSTIGGAGVQSPSGDPWEGCYLGHGISEGSYEGWYNTDSSANDSQGYTTWVR